jgi:hypothetical protein
MAAINLTYTPPFSIRAVASVGTTLQQFNLPASDARQVSITADAACWIQSTGADGDATTSTARWPLAANATATFSLRSGAGGTKVLVAAQSGTATVTVCVEGGAA